MMVSINTTTLHVKHVHLKACGQIQPSPYEQRSQLSNLSFQTPCIGNGSDESTITNVDLGKEAWETN